jgi:hypothetical protein
VKNHDFTPKNLIFSTCGGRREHFWGYLDSERQFKNSMGYFVLSNKRSHLIVKAVQQISTQNEESRFYAQKSYFFHLRRETRTFLGVFRVKNRDFTPKNHIFFQFYGGRAPGALPPGSAPAPNNSYKPITNTALVRESVQRLNETTTTRLCKFSLGSSSRISEG